MSKRASGIVVFALGTLVIWNLKEQRVVAQSTMQAETIPRAYRKVQNDWLHDLTSEIGIASRGINKRILNHSLNCVTTLNLGNFQSNSRHLRLSYHSIEEDIAKGEIEIKHVAGTEMHAEALTTALVGVKLGEYVEDIGHG